jgi:hypothetical protein
MLAGGRLNRIVEFGRIVLCAFDFLAVERLLQLRAIGHATSQNLLLRSPDMKRFLVTYLAPASVIDDWKKTEPAQRKEAEQKMQAEWKKWMSDNASKLVDKGAGVGKTKRVSAQGTSDTRNDIMLYAIVEAESHEAAAKAFEGHPHLQIPKSSIEIMEIHSLSGM